MYVCLSYIVCRSANEKSYRDHVVDLNILLLWRISNFLGKGYMILYGTAINHHRFYRLFLKPAQYVRMILFPASDRNSHFNNYVKMLPPVAPLPGAYVIINLKKSAKRL